VFDEKRVKNEIEHNSLIKDTMRNTNTMRDIITFLTVSITSLNSSNLFDYSKRCLLCLGEFSAIIVNFTIFDLKRMIFHISLSCPVILTSPICFQLIVHIFAVQLEQTDCYALVS
jgi:hypothetical protein